MLDLSEIDHHSIERFINCVDPFFGYPSNAISSSLEVVRSLNPKLHNIQHFSKHKTYLEDGTCSISRNITYFKIVAAEPMTQDCVTAVECPLPCISTVPRASAIL